MKWVYILKCEDNYYYVGETSRLFRRFWEHSDGCGGVNTSIYRPEYVVAIYKVNTLGKFFEYNKNVIDAINNDNTIDNQLKYNKWLLKKFNDDVDYDYDNLEAENNITECLMVNNKSTWEKIRGGKYTRFIEYKFPINEVVKELPLCNCGLPCDIKKHEDNNYLFFRCAKKNMWESFKEQFDVDNEPCNFFMEYTKDKQFRLEETNRSEKLKSLFKKSFWLKNVEINDDTYPKQCVGGCYRTSKSIKMSYFDVKRNLCYDCFIDKNEELSKKYNVISEGICLLKLK
jgi:predicted GIY-YIG superfamily endonuclease